MSDIEGKVARVAMRACGQRPSFKSALPAVKRLSLGCSSLQRRPGIHLDRGLPGLVGCPEFLFL